MVCPTLPAMPAIEATPTIEPLSLTTPWSSSSRVIRSGATRLTSSTASQRSSSMLASFLSWVMPALWTTTSTPPCFSFRWWAIRCGASLAVMSRVRWSPSSSPHQRLQLAGRLRDVEPDDGRAVAVQDPGDLLADAAAGAGDQRDLAGERALPVGRPRRRRVAWVPIRTTWPETYADFGESRKRERRGDRRLGALGDVDELDRAAAADLLAERAGEALERALGDPLGARRPAPAGCRARRPAGRSRGCAAAG